MKFIAFCSLILGALLVAGCARYFTPNINLDRYATKEEIVGTWQLSPTTLELAEHDGYHPPKGQIHEIQFHPDGTCTFRSITEWGQKATYRSEEGTWALEHDTEHKGERKRKNELKVILGSEGLSYYPTEEEGKILLWYWWGDPDSWEFIKYKKR